MSQYIHVKLGMDGKTPTVELAQGENARLPMLVNSKHGYNLPIMYFMRIDSLAHIIYMLVITTNKHGYDRTAIRPMTTYDAALNAGFDYVKEQHKHSSDDSDEDSDENNAADVDSDDDADSDADNEDAEYQCLKDCYRDLAQFGTVPVCGSGTITITRFASGQPFTPITPYVRQ